MNHCSKVIKGAGGGFCLLELILHEEMNVGNCLIKSVIRLSIALQRCARILNKGVPQLLFLEIRNNSCDETHGGDCHSKYRVLLQRKRHELLLQEDI